MIYKTAKTKHDYAEAKELFLEYKNSLGFDLCFQNFEAEIKDLTAQYSAPTGRIILCHDGILTAGCVGLRYFSEGICEMKRLYVKPEFRGQGTGRVLARKIVTAGKELGYRKMVLDTLETMKAAIELYRSMGFKEIPQYRVNPVESAVYMELYL